MRVCAGSHASPALAATHGGAPHYAAMDDRLRERQERRVAFLRTLYDDVDSSVTTFVSGFEVGERIGADRAESLKIIEYYAEKELIKVDDYATGMVRLTAAGVDAVESA